MISYGLFLILAPLILIGNFLCYHAGLRRGIQIGSVPDINFLRHIKLPTADEVKKQAEEKFPL